MLANLSSVMKKDVPIISVEGNSYQKYFPILTVR